MTEQKPDWNKHGQQIAEGFMIFGIKVFLGILIAFVVFLMLIAQMGVWGLFVFEIVVGIILYFNIAKRWNKND